MLGMLLALSLHPFACCITPVKMDQYSGMICLDKASAETLLQIYTEHKEGDKKVIEKMVKKTHQCSMVAYKGRPLYKVYHGKLARGPTGLGEIVGISFNPMQSAIFYAIMPLEGYEI